MAMRVAMSTLFRHIQGNLGNLAKELQQINASLASGKKYHQLSDQPLEIASILGLTTESGQAVQYQRNLGVAQEWLRMTESILQNVNELVRGAMSLANQMATGTYQAAQRAAAAQEVQGLLEEVMQVGNTRLNGQYLLAGYRVQTPPFVLGDWQIKDPVLNLRPDSTGSISAAGVFTGATSRTYVVELVTGGASGTATYRVSSDGGQTWSTPEITGAGAAIGNEGVTVDFSGTWVAGDRFSISVWRPILYQGDEYALELGIGRESRLTVAEVGSVAIGGDGGGLDLFQLLGRLQGGLQANDGQEIGAALEGLRAYQNHLDSRLAALGASLNRVEVKTGVYDTLQNRLAAAISNKSDTDVVAAVNTLKALETAYQAALLAATKVMNLSLLEYL